MSDDTTAVLDRVEQLLDEVRQLVDSIKASTPRAYSPEEIALMVDLHPNTIRKMVKDGALQRIPNTGRRVCIADTEIERMWGITMGGAA